MQKHGFTTSLLCFTKNKTYRISYYLYDNRVVLLHSFSVLTENAPYPYYFVRELLAHRNLQFITALLAFISIDYRDESTEREEFLKLLAGEIKFVPRNVKMRLDNSITPWEKS